MTRKAPVAEPVSPKPQIPDAPAGYDRLALVPGIYTALLLILLTIGAVYVLGKLRLLLILLYLSVLIACGIAGPVGWLERRGLHRSVAILFIFALVGLVLVAIGWFAVPTIIGQAGSIAEDLPDRVSLLQQYWRRMEDMRDQYPVMEQLEPRLADMLASLGGRITDMILMLPSIVAMTIFAVTSMLTFSFLFLMTWEKMLNLVLSLVHPRHREQTRDVMQEIGLKLGAYLRAKVIVMVIVGAWMYFALKWLGSPYAMLVAIFIGLMEGLPRIGPWIGRIGMVIVLIPLGWKAVAIAVVAHVVIDNIKGYVLSPLIEGSQVDIHPLTAFIAVIAGGLLLGWVGAFVAVPTAAVIQVVIEQVVIPWRRGQLAAAEAEFSAAEESR